jgi:hypothetical protein
LNIGRAMRAILCLALVGAACEPPGYGRHDPDAAPGDGTHGDGTKAIDAAIDAPAQNVCDHGFRLDNHAGATSVWLTGDFIAWGGDPGHGAVVFALGADGVWTGSRQFAAGSYLYKFIVDGTQWIADPGNPDSVDDGFGGKNSVYSCMP